MDGQRITIDPRVRWGTPCIRDTGVSVGRIITLLHDGGLTPAEVVDAHPGLAPEDVEAALGWHQEHGDDGLRPRPPDPRPHHPRIAVDPGIQGGYPTIRGTRIPVDVVVGFWEHGLSLEELLDEYPALTADDVEAALAYALDARA